MPSTRSAQLRPRRQHQHGHVPAVRPPALQERHPVKARQAEIEDDQVIILRIAEEPRVLAVGRGFDRIARSAQDGGDIGRNAGIVLDEKQAHQSASSSTIAIVLASS
jgi:hypothetical protein